MSNPNCPLCGQPMTWDTLFEDYFCPDCEFSDDEDVDDPRAAFDDEEGE